MVMFVMVVLSFRLIAEERQNHSMILLQAPRRSATPRSCSASSSPRLTFLAAALWLLSLYMPLLIKVNGKITWSQVLVGYLGLMLLGSVRRCALGVFALGAHPISRLSSALLGALFVAIMVMLFPLAKRLDTPVREVLEQLDLWWIHFQNGFMRGVLNLKDVVYYLAVTYFFLLLATKTLEAKRWQ